ncbi:MAG: molybdopterin-binding protein [Bacteroidota bacterium]
MKNFNTIILLFIVQFSFAQKDLVPTDSFKITGKVKNEKTITLADLKKHKSLALENINTSCSAKQKEVAKEVKAVLLKDILDSVAFQYESPRALNEFYFKFIASDGYTIVYSFNEIYNTETGNNMYIVTEKDGKDVSEMENRILLLTTSDIKTGKRNIKGLANIVVCIAE